MASFANRKRRHGPPGWPTANGRRENSRREPRGARAASAQPRSCHSKDSHGSSEPVRSATVLFEASTRAVRLELAGRPFQHRTAFAGSRQPLRTSSAPKPILSHLTPKQSETFKYPVEFGAPIDLPKTLNFFCFCCVSETRQSLFTRSQAISRAAELIKLKGKGKANEIPRATNEGPRTQHTATVLGTRQTETNPDQSPKPKHKRRKICLPFWSLAAKQTSSNRRSPAPERKVKGPKST